MTGSSVRLALDAPVPPHVSRRRAPHPGRASASISTLSVTRHCPPWGERVQGTREREQVTRASRHKGQESQGVREQDGPPHLWSLVLADLSLDALLTCSFSLVTLPSASLPGDRPASRSTASAACRRARPAPWTRAQSSTPTRRAPALPRDRRGRAPSDDRIPNAATPETGTAQHGQGPEAQHRLRRMPPCVAILAFEPEHEQPGDPPRGVGEDRGLFPAQAERGLGHGRAGRRRRGPDDGRRHARPA